MTIKNLHHYRYALIAWGGRQEGKRPSTKLAEILEVGKGSEYAKVRFWLGDHWSKIPRSVAVSEIYNVWVVCPSQPDIATARRAIPKVPLATHWKDSKGKLHPIPGRGGAA